MPAIDQKISAPNPDVASNRIQIPDDSDWGTGTFTSVTKPFALKAKRVTGSAMINPPRFQISLTFNTDHLKLAVLLGPITDSADQTTTAVFSLPRYIKRNVEHTFVVQFAAWKIFSATLDGKPLQEKAGTAH